MGRQPKPKAIRLHNRVLVRFTDAEVKQMTARIKDLKLSDRSEYIRRLIREDLQNVQ